MSTLVASDRLGTQVRWRLVVPITALLLLSSLDRVNISFAALGMNQSLGLSPAQYGFGAGVLFVGFLAGQYPSILLLQRIGMRRWVSGCAISWALCAGGLAFVHSPGGFYTLRVILGLAEAGLAPGVVLYLSQFTAARDRARTFGVPMIAIPLSVALGSPLSGALMSLHTPGHLAPWQWLLLIEAAPALLVGILARGYFPDHPQAARWLSPQDQAFLQAHAGSQLQGRPANDWRVLREPIVWMTAILWFCLLSGSYGIIFWLPQIVRAVTGHSVLAIGWINALPWLGAAVGMYVNAVHSDRTGERFWHVAAPALLAAVATVAAWWFGAGIAGLAALILMGVGLGAAQGAFWSVPTLYLTRSTLAVAAVMINLLGSAGGLVMPHWIGYALQWGGGPGSAAGLIGGVLAVGGALTLLLRARCAPRSL